MPSALNTLAVGHRCPIGVNEINKHNIQRSKPSQFLDADYVFNSVSHNIRATINMSQ